MNTEDPADNRPVEQVSDSDEGRLAYIADMAAELAAMASRSKEAELAGQLDDARRTAVLSRERRMRG